MLEPVSTPPDQRPKILVPHENLRSNFQYAPPRGQTGVGNTCGQPKPQFPTFLTETFQSDELNTPTEQIRRVFEIPVPIKCTAPTGES